MAFVVPLAVARSYGAGPETDAFFWALAAPTFVYAVATAVTGPAVMPLLTRLRAEDPHGVGRLLGGALFFGAALTAALAAGMWTLGPWLATGTAGMGPEAAPLATAQLAALAPMTVLVGLIALLRTANEAEGSFLTSVGAPLARGSVTLAGVLLARPLGAAVALPMAYALGAVAELLTLMLGLRGGASWPRLPDGLARGRLRTLGLLALPLLGAEAVLALGPAIDRSLASGLGAGAVSALEYADRARLVPRTMLDATLVAVSLRAWSVARARGDHAGQRRAVATSVWWVLLLAPPALAGMSIGRVVIVGLLYGGGAMAPHALNATAEALDGYLPGVLGGLLAMLLARAWVVEGRAGRFLAAAVASVAVNGLVGAFATERFGVRGTAWGTSAGLWTLALLAGRGLGAPVWRALPPRAWAWAGAVNLLAWGAAVATRSAPPPDRIDAPRLWGAAFGLVSLLAIAGARAKRGP